ncbi:MAG: hypothetical protein N3F05_01545 [Candidatus Diapherotrites archaeon]|nr:hypothetical protein [Candidatus Diapherotrites archaeon]
MPKIKAVFRGPLLRERMLIYLREKNRGTRSLRHRLERAKRIRLAQSIKHNLEFFDGTYDLKRIERRLKAAKNLRERIPIKNPAMHHNKGIRQIRRIEALEQEVLDQLKTLGIGLSFVEEKGVIVPVVSIHEKTTRTSITIAYGITKKAIERKKELMAGLDNIILELSLSARESRKPEYRDEVKKYRDELLARSSFLGKLEIVDYALSMRMREKGWNN